ncbi:hypothetical protein [Streptomyces sp. NPDC090080]|uniref:hypothetical protein n=1 Tax=Streptomyces sp. NPDC090080 TaxID=3365939 RepID=UPI00382F9A16
MEDLLALATRAHGGSDRWKTVSRFRLNAEFGGAIWAMKGKKGIADSLVIVGETRSQRTVIAPFPEAERISTWEPGRQTIEFADGVVIAEQLEPQSQFVGHTRQSPWNYFQAAYFASQFCWNSVVVPFLFLRSDFFVEEGPRRFEDDEAWRSLRVIYPGGVVTHCREQTFYFDSDGLLRRVDYNLGVLGVAPVVHYMTDYRTFDGITAPTVHQVHVRNPDSTPAKESQIVSLFVRDATFD